MFIVTAKKEINNMQKHTQSNSVDITESHNSQDPSSTRVLIVTAVDAEKKPCSAGLTMLTDLMSSRVESAQRQQLLRLPASWFRAPMIGLSAQVLPEDLPVVLKLVPSSLRTPSLPLISVPKPKTASAASRSSASERIGYRQIQILPANSRRPYNMLVFP